MCVDFILIHEFHNLSWITEINEHFHDILIYWDAPVYEINTFIKKRCFNQRKTSVWKYDISKIWENFIYNIILKVAHLNFLHLTPMF